MLAGLVPGYDKPGHQVADDAELAVDRPPRFVSRGGEKLANALEQLEVELDGRDCIDVGASTGGFTDYLLQNGVARVIAVDVGYGQLHPKLRDDPRVTVLERTNARGLHELPFRPDLLVCDVSFISVRLALPPVLALLEPGWDALVLVKPQFEAGKDEVGKGGVVRDPEIHRRVLREVVEAGLGWGATAVGVVDSRLPGPKGNREFFVHLINRDDPVLLDDIDERIRARSRLRRAPSSAPPSSRTASRRRSGLRSHGSRPSPARPASSCDVDEEEAQKHGLDPSTGDAADVDIAVVLGGDGTMLRALGPLSRHERARDRRQLRHASASWPRSRGTTWSRGSPASSRASTRSRSCRRSTSRSARSGASP